MKTHTPDFRFRKCSDVNREYALFELLDREAILFDIGFSDSGVLEIAFGGAIVGHIIKTTELIKLIEEGGRLASIDRRD